MSPTAEAPQSPTGARPKRLTKSAPRPTTLPSLADAKASGARQ